MLRQVLQEFETTSGLISLNALSARPGLDHQTLVLMLYSPCLGTLAALSKEVGWKWTLRTTAITLSTGFSFTILIYWGGVLLGLG